MVLIHPSMGGHQGPCYVEDGMRAFHCSYEAKCPLSQPPPPAYPPPPQCMGPHSWVGVHSSPLRGLR